MPRKTPLVERIDARILADAEASVRANVVLPLGRLTAVKLAPSARDELVRGLEARGLERKTNVLRVPVVAQLEALLCGGARIARKDLAKRVKGAKKAEIDSGLAKLVREARAHIVVRTELEVVVGGGEQVLSLAEMQQWGRAITNLAKTVKKVQVKGLPKTMLREDFDAVLGLSGAMVKSGETNRGGVSAEQLVVDAVEKLEDPNLKLVRIADLVRKLAPQLSKDEVHRVLARAFELGTIELRPDAGTEFLKAEDVALCLPGPRGTVFSYARRMSS